MTLKQYQKVRVLLVFLLAMAFSVSLQYRNFLIPLGLLVAGSLATLRLRRSVQGVVADERDYALGGKAALLAIQAYSWVAVVVMFVFYSLRDLNPAYEPIGMVLAFSTLVLMLTYALIYRYYERFSFSDKRFLYILCVLILFAAMFVAGVRSLGGEDDWICVDGQWTEHGHPSFPAPTMECK